LNLVAQSESNKISFQVQVNLNLPQSVETKKEEIVSETKEIETKVNTNTPMNATEVD